MKLIYIVLDILYLNFLDDYDGAYQLRFGEENSIDFYYYHSRFYDDRNILLTNMVNTSNNISFDVNLNRSVGFSDCVHFNLNKKTSMIDKLYLSDFISCDLDHTNAGNFTCEITKNDRNDGFLRFEIIPIFKSIEIRLPDTINGTIQCEMATTSHKNDVHDFLLHFTLPSSPMIGSKQSLTMGGITATMPTILVIVVIVFVSVGSCLCYRDFRVKQEMKRILQIYKSEDIR